MSDYLASFIPAVANHLWQSTAFAAAAWALTLLLRKNSARIRYVLWLAASVKFLLPFSLLIAAGHLLPRPSQSIAPAVYTAMKVTEQPFADVAISATNHRALTLSERMAADITTALLGLWLAGTAGVLTVWFVRWRRASACLHDAVPAVDGHEIDILRGLEARLTSPRPSLRLKLSSEPIEPSIYGVLRPVLLWPKQLSERLSDEHIEAIIAHELVHARRFDNAAAALHMLVEAVFWFHPLAWWMEHRMIEERERACDEAVVSLGSSPDSYAEGILRTCRFCLGSALPCAAGVTGADLRERIFAIMTASALRRTTWPKKLLIVAAALCLMAIPVLVGQSQTPPSFEVASIKKLIPDNGPGRTMRRRMGATDPGTFRAVGETAKDLICEAYDLYDYQVSGGPPWIVSDLFEVDAKVDDATAAQLQNLTRHEQNERMNVMLQTLLADRFKLQVTREKKAEPAYALIVAKGGPKLKDYSADETRTGSMRVENGLVDTSDKGIQMSNFAAGLSVQLKENVLDQTGLTGTYDIELTYAPQTGLSTDPSAANPAANSIFDALQDQLGLKLVSIKAPMETITIVHIEEPTPN